MEGDQSQAIPGEQGGGSHWDAGGGCRMDRWEAGPRGRSVGRIQAGLLLKSDLPYPHDSTSLWGFTDKLKA